MLGTCSPNANSSDLEHNFRDLAARNCLVSQDEVVKVGDLGMARHMYTSNFYLAQSNHSMPIRWMAPESISDRTFTSQSDVWSYSVVLWEIATLAEIPYQAKTNEEVMFYVKSGGSLQFPENCPDIFQSLALKCWKTVPDSRPTFLDVCKYVPKKALPEKKLADKVSSALAFKSS